MVATLKILATYDICLTAGGTIGNIVVFILCLRIKNNSTFALMRFLALSDLVSLYWWNVDHFMVPFFNLDFQSMYVFYCRLADFSQYSSLQISAWLLVAISFDRYLGVIIKNWRISIMTPLRANILGFLIVIIFIGINLHVLFTFGHVIEIENGTYINQCYQTDDPTTRIMGITQLIHSILYSYVPFALLAIANFLLILHLRLRAKNSSVKTSDSQKKKHAKMNLTVIIITILFIIMTLPSALVSIYYNDLIITYTGTAWAILGNSIGFTYHGFSFFTLYFTNSRFRDEFKGLFKCCFPNRSSSGGNSSNNKTQSLIL